MGSDSHKYYANAIGVAAFFAFITFSVRSCNEKEIEEEKTKQIEIIHNKGKVYEKQVDYYYGKGETKK